MPRVCLINPPHPYLSNPDAQAPLGLLYLASSLQEHGCEDVQFVNLSNRHYDDISDIDLPDCEIYGITGTVLDRRGINAVAKHIKMHNKQGMIVAGGPITLCMDLVDRNLVDSFVFGEGEYVIRQIVDDYPNLKNVYVADRITDLDVLPYPDRDLLDGKLGQNIFADRETYFDNGSTVICSSRGCPNACAFCASVKLWGRKVVYRSVQNVVDEIEHVIGTYGVRQFRFSDDNLTSSRLRLDSLCEALRGYEIAWRASIRVKPSSVQMFTAMRRAGCREVCFGIESGDPAVLKMLDKSATVSDNKRAIRDAKEAGLVVRLLMMTGCPGETTGSTNLNINFLDEMEPWYDTVAITNFTPIPGTRVADDPDSVDCEILDFDIDKYNLCLWKSENEMNSWMNLIRPNGMSVDELVESKRQIVEWLVSSGKINKG